MRPLYKLIVLGAVAIVILTGLAIGAKLRNDKIDDCVKFGQATTMEACEELINVQTPYHLLRGFAYSVTLWFILAVCGYVFYIFGHSPASGYNDKVDL